MNSLEFDNWVETYEADVFRKRDIYPFDGYFEHVEMLKSTISRKEGCRVLDMGIGTGLMHSLIREDCDYLLDGLDFSKEMCAFSSIRFPDSIIKKWDLALDSVPSIFLSKSYDLIISAYCLHHFDTAAKKRILDQFGRLLSREGRLVVIDIAFDNIESRDHQAQLAGSSWDHEEADGYLIKDQIGTIVPEEYDWTYTKVSDCSAHCMLFHK